MKTEITKERLIDDLTALGVEAGNHIGVALSFKSLGPVNGGPETFIDALLDIVGAEGTIMFNIFTSNKRLSDLAFCSNDCIFDAQSSTCNTGIVAERTRLRPNALRSRHSITSIAAIGLLAEYLTGGHDENTPAYTPFSKPAEAGGKILSIGLGERMIGIRHEAQSLAGLLAIVPLRRGTLYRNTHGEIRRFLFKGPGGCVRKLPKMLHELRQKDIVNDGAVGQAKSVLVPAREALTVMANLLRRDPSLYLCNNIGCLWCREIERRLNLYPKIKNPLYFQRHQGIISIVSRINQVRLKDYRWVASLRHQAKNVFRNR
ncbi:AAC(3) family N-acetyltransferase [Gammaproteobacteria bacterium]|nr:AAC(3) family N-acetyltransferase [Gammaproteobacteria bacterium]